MLIQWLIPFRKRADRLPQSSKAIELRRDTKVRTFPARGVTFICQRFAMTEIRLLVTSPIPNDPSIPEIGNDRIASIKTRSGGSFLDPRYRP
jgi:hypothetical protein